MNQSNSKLWLGIAAAGVVALVLFILLDPGVDQQGKGEAVLWSRSWQAIEYDPGAALKEEAARMEQEREAKLAEDPDDEDAVFDPDDYKGKFRFRLLRKAGLYEDDFATETPRAGRPGAELVRHEGNLTVRNIFREWSEPKYKAVYDRRSARELDRDFAEDGRRLLLFEKIGGEPVVLQIGGKLDNGNTVIKYSTEPDSVYLIPTFMLQKFDYIFSNYRLKRVLYYPTGSYSREIDVTRGSDGAEIALRQTRIQQDKKTEQLWKTADGYEVSLNNASQIDNYVKQIQIDRFDDEARAAGHGDLEKLWEEAGKDDWTLRVDIAGGEEVTLHLRGADERFDERLKSTPQEKTKTGEERLLLLKASNRDSVHLTAGRHARNLKTKFVRVESEVKTRKRNEELKQKGDELRKQNPPPPPPAKKN